MDFRFWNYRKPKDTYNGVYPEDPSQKNVSQEPTYLTTLDKKAATKAVKKNEGE